MSRQTDSLENNTIDGNLTILPGINPDNGLGDLEVRGSIYTDIIGENTINNGVNLEGTNFSHSYFTMSDITTPTIPSINKNIFYVDSDNFFKSINSSGIIKIYNPLNNKGDLLSHNGTIDTILHLGNPGQILTVDNTSSTGLSWTNNNSENIFTLLDKNINSSILPVITGSYYICIAPLISNGASSLFFSSKSIHTNSANIYRMNNNISLVNSGTLNFSWDSYKTGSIYKDYTEGNGDYININNSSFHYNQITLSGTSWVSINSSTSGSFFYSINSENEGPCVTFAICKSDSTLNSGALFIISSSPSVSGNNIGIRWITGSGIEISKNTSSDDGIYDVIDNFQIITNISISLSGISTVNLPKSFFKYYENKSFILRIYSTIINSPKTIIYMSKNSYTLHGNQTSINSPGSTGEKLHLNWDINSLLSVYKDNTNYDGIYQIDICQF